MKRVLVTGAGGFVGRQALAPLLARGFEVHATDLRPPAADTPGVRWHVADLLVPGQASHLAKEVAPTHLLHLAWYAVHGRFWTAPENLGFVQVSLELLRAFVEAGGIRATVAGTCAEYQWGEPGPCLEASTPLRPATLYGVSKDALRRLLEAYAGGSGLHWSWGRLFLLHGPHEDRGRLVPSVIGSMLSGQPVRLSRGEQRRDFLHVADVAGALVALLDSAVAGPVNIASGEPVSIRQVVERLAVLTGYAGRPEFGALPDRPGDPPLLVGDPRRLREEVGYSPRYDLDRGLQESVTWWRQTLTSEPNPNRPR